MQRAPSLAVLTAALLFSAGCPAPLAAQPQWPGKTPSAAEVEAAVAKAVKFLVGFQEKYERDRGYRGRGGPALGEWKKEEEARLAKLRKRSWDNAKWPYQGVYREGGSIPPGYRVGGTSIVCLSLMEAPGFAEDKKRRAAVERGLEFVVDQFEEVKALNSGFSGGYDVRGWAHTYGLHVLVKALEKGVPAKSKVKRYRKTAQWLCKVLAETEIPENGGWNYARRGGRRSGGSSGKVPGGSPSSFMTSSTLLHLFEAKAAGFDVDGAVVKRALDALERGRAKENGAYQYSIGGGGPGGTKVPGACARMAIAESVLLLAGRGSVDRLRVAVDAFFDGWEELYKRHAKTGTHTGAYGIAPYYFHYGHTYAGLAIEQLPEGERASYRDRLREIYWRTRAEDGSWNDRVFPRSKGYSTAMALLGLLMPQIKAASWQGSAGKKRKKV